jgi:hypothetical protein
MQAPDEHPIINVHANMQYIMIGVYMKKSSYSQVSERVLLHACSLTKQLTRYEKEGTGGA